MFSIKSYMRIIITLAVLALALLSSIAVFSQEVAADDKTEISFYAYGDTEKAETRINSTVISGVNTITLPATVSESEVTLYTDYDGELYISGESAESVLFVSGEPLNLEKLCPEKNYTLKFSDGVESEEVLYELRMIFLKNIPSVYLLSDEPETKGREWVESSADKSNKATGKVLMQDETGNAVHSGSLTQIKGRGNTTWGLKKKPYQIKLSEKADLLQTGDEGNKSKTWILLANYLDPAGIRNTLALNLGSALGMPTNIQGKSVNLYYDGEYRGLYMLTEKVEVGSGRVDIVNLDDENAAVNAEVTLDTLPVLSDVTENGATYMYCEGMKSPEDISGGYLLEMDYEERAKEEVCYFCTKRGVYVVVKSPEFASKEEMEYIATLYQEYEDAVYEGGVNPDTGKKYSDYVDVRSVACYYLVNEFSKSRDCFKSSAYLHKNAGEDKLYMGPLWDYDMSFGKGDYNYYEDDIPYGISTIETDMCKALFGIDEFHQITKDIYLNEFLPIIKNIVLGDKDAESENGALKSLEYYRLNIADSGICNAYLWHDGKSWNEEIDNLYNFINVRQEVLSGYFNDFSNLMYVPDSYYYDVLPDAWYYDVITEATKKGILSGMEMRRFRPEMNVLRSHAVQAIFNMSEKSDVLYEPLFTDVVENEWYTNVVVWAVKNDFADGYDDGTFKPDSAITREDFTDILYRFSGSPEVKGTVIDSFNDAASVTKKNAVEWALETGVLIGDEESIKPSEPMTRAEFAAMLVRFSKTDVLIDEKKETEK